MTLRDPMVRVKPGAAGQSVSAAIDYASRYRTAARKAMRHTSVGNSSAGPSPAVQVGSRSGHPTVFGKPRAVADSQNENRQNVSLYLVDNPIVTDTQPKEPFFPAESLHSPWARVVGQGVDPWL